jgi:hypothetical protein
LEAALKAHRAGSPKVFGSVARNDATKKSDIDFLVEFERGASAFDQAALIIDLEELFQRKVDIVEPGGIHWLIRPQVLFEAIPV